MDKGASLVVVDDEPDIREMLQEYLEAQGFDVTTADGGEALRKIVSERDVDLAVLDITMPGEDGLSLARYLRENFDLGIIMLTGASDVVDRIIGLEVGADDYIAKPVDLRELLARVKSVLRRTAAKSGDRAALHRPAETVGFGKCKLDLGSHRLLDAGGEEIPITAMEFDLMRAFSERPNRVLSRDQLLELAHNRGWEPFDRSIDIRIARLRRKIEEDPSKPRFLKTVRGAGYVFCPEGDN